MFSEKRKKKLRESIEFSNKNRILMFQQTFEESNKSDGNQPFINLNDYDSSCEISQNCHKEGAFNSDQIIYDSKSNMINKKFNKTSVNVGNSINFTNNNNNCDQNFHDDIIPSGTKWEITSPCICYCCCCFNCNYELCNLCNEYISPCVKVEGKRIERSFWGFLELDLCGPTIAVILIILAHITFSFTVLHFIKMDHSANFFIFVSICTFFLLLMFLWSFLGAACSDPGFLPFDWDYIQRHNHKITQNQSNTIESNFNQNESNFELIFSEDTNESKIQYSQFNQNNKELNFSNQIKNQPDSPRNESNLNFNDDSFVIIPKISWRTQLSGLAFRPDQVEYAKLHCPSYATFSRSAGRYIIRADHICAWTGNWVGKRNHKQFILMTFWGTLMMLNLFFWQFKFAFLKTKNKEGEKVFKYLFSIGPFGFIIQCLAVFLEPIFLIIFLIAFIQALIDVVRNTTKIKKWKKLHQTFDVGNIKKKFSLFQSMKNICGKSSILCWIFPFPAFGDEIVIENEELFVDTPQIMY